MGPGHLVSPPQYRTVSVRAATPGDAERLVDWILAVAEESEGLALDRDIVATGIAAALGDPEHRRYYIAERDGIPVGCCMVTTEWSDWSARWNWWLQSIWVEPDHRGREHGVLDALVQYVHETARTEGISKVYLYVHKDNHRAIRAYEKRGYQKTDYLVHRRHP